MYLTGDLKTFQSRIHIYITGQSDINSYLTEGKVYVTGVSPQASGKWERELQMGRYRFTHSGQVLSEPLAWV